MLRGEVYGVRALTFAYISNYAWDAKYDYKNAENNLLLLEPVPHRLVVCSSEAHK